MSRKPKNWERKLEDIVRRLIILGYEMGRKQCKTPYEYTCDTDKGEKCWKEIKSLLASQKAEIESRDVRYCKKYIKEEILEKIKLEKKNYLAKDNTLTIDAVDGYNQAVEDLEKLKEKL
ncbi:MAG TPA: hypothetical protein ENH85_00480 [Candidatus Scalindua sp.]|nr:hypothetical protein [Candidatus Scalindua sp.]